MSEKMVDGRESRESRHPVSDRLAVVLIGSVWIALIALINPVGEMILNDDGAYAYTVKSILDTGRFKLSPWDTPNLFSQAYWGALFCWPFGFSHTALRFSTLTLALVALLALYGLLREAGVASTAALIGVFILALNPLFFELSFTYMTDVPFLGFTLAALYLLVRGLKRQSRVELVLGVLAATAALLTRQTGLALFFALSICCLVKNGWNKRNAIKAAAPALLGLGVQFSYQTWLRLTGRMPAIFGKQAVAALDVGAMSLPYATKHIVLGTVVALSYAGLFVMPLLLLIGAGRWRNLWGQHPMIASLTSIMLFAAAGYAMLRHYRMPFLGNVLYDFGLGPTIRSDLNPLPSAGPLFWTAVTIISVLAAALLLQLLVSVALLLVRTRGQNQELLVMILATGMIYFVPIALVPEMYDRYLLLFVPLSTVLLFAILRRGDGPSRYWVVLAAFFLFAYGSFAIAGTHDYLSWQRCRWQAIQTLSVAKHIRPQQIDGGYEFNCTYISPPDYSPAVGDEFVISLGPARGYLQNERYSYRRWLPPGEGAIFVLQKVPSGPTVPREIPGENGNSSGLGSRR